jgi:hypothetical protein
MSNMVNVVVEEQVVDEQEPQDVLLHRLDEEAALVLELGNPVSSEELQSRVEKVVKRRVQRFDLALLIINRYPDTFAETVKREYFYKDTSHNDDTLSPSGLEKLRWIDPQWFDMVIFKARSIVSEVYLLSSGHINRLPRESAMIELFEIVEKTYGRFVFRWDDMSTADYIAYRPLKLVCGAITDLWESSTCAVEKAALSNYADALMKGLSNSCGDAAFLYTLRFYDEGILGRQELDALKSYKLAPSEFFSVMEPLGRRPGWLVKQMFSMLSGNITISSKLFRHMLWECPETLASNMHQVVAEALHDLLKKESETDLAVLERYGVARSDIWWHIAANIWGNDVEQAVPHLVQSWNPGNPLHLRVAGLIYHRLAGLLEPEQLDSVEAAIPAAVQLEAVKHIRLQYLDCNSGPGSLPQKKRLRRWLIRHIRGLDIVDLDLLPVAILLKKGGKYSDGFSREDIIEMILKAPYLKKGQDGLIQDFQPDGRHDLGLSPDLLSILDEKYHIIPKLELPAKKVMVNWQDGDSWRLFMENWRSDGRWKVDNGEGYDTGGICNALYEDLGGKLDQKWMEQLGSWRVPRVDLGQCELEMLGCILARSFCVDQKPLGIDLHPIVWGCLGWRWLWRLAPAPPLAMVRWMLGAEWLRDIAPATSWEEVSNEDALKPGSADGFIAEIYERYRPLLSLMWPVYQAFTAVYSHSVTPRQLEGRIRADGSADVDNLLQHLFMSSHGEVDVQPYTASLIRVLRTMTLDERREVYRFWFGTSRPDHTDAYIELIATPPAEGPVVLYSHTCVYTLKVPAFEFDKDDRAQLDSKMSAAIKLTLENQRLASSAGYHFQFR